MWHQGQNMILILPYQGTSRFELALMMLRAVKPFLDRLVIHFLYDAMVVLANFLLYMILILHNQETAHFELALVMLRVVKLFPV